ncbi:hypothetical protein BG846_00671 [Streptomyces fradiae ATCC 10745 = DSM 40063]|uniref:Uncharacterized protein n=1 Tax=Streptomyces fradiae ATCC 10745 = DSM 40063 TaxID=1319510 RepID=A0A1Y2P1H1_STRFR|nr:hypothetical protein BG846_00671 [Streptomyces fradiae ATCC 10745 = DSM 40063]
MRVVREEAPHPGRVRGSVVAWGRGPRTPRGRGARWWRARGPVRGPVVPVLRGEARGPVVPVRRSAAGAGGGPAPHGEVRGRVGAGQFRQVSVRVTLPLAGTVATRLAPLSQVTLPAASLRTYLYSKVVPAGRVRSSFHTG